MVPQPLPLAFKDPLGEEVEGGLLIQLPPLPLHGLLSAEPDLQGPPEDALLPHGPSNSHEQGVVPGPGMIPAEPLQLLPATAVHKGSKGLSKQGGLELHHPGKLHEIGGELRPRPEPGRVQKPVVRQVPEVDEEGIPGQGREGHVRGVVEGR